MAAADPLVGLQEGTFPLRFAPTATAALTGSKRAATGEVVALRYAFKPASVTAETPGSLEPTAAGGRILAYDLPGGGSQVFDVREEQSKARECVIVWDEGKQAFVLHALPATYHLTLNRNLSAQRAAGEMPVPVVEEPRKKARESVSRDPSPAPPLAKAKGGGNTNTSVSHSLPAGVASITESGPPRPVKKKGGKKAAAPIPADVAEPQPSPKGKKKAAPKKAAPKKKAAKAAPPPKKSAEIIEDSDEDDGMDEFANMLGEAVAAPELPGYDDEEEEEEEEDDDELGGARYGGYHEAAADEEAEWI